MANKDKALVKYTSTKVPDKMFVSKYLLELPDRKVLESIIKKEVEE